MKVLMTGGAGINGRLWVEDLVAHGHEVMVYDNLSTGDRKSLPFAVKFVFGDVRDSSLLTRALKDFRPDLVIHCAQYFRDEKMDASKVSKMELLDHNLSGLIQVLKAFDSSECGHLWIRQLEGDLGLQRLQNEVVQYAAHEVKEASSKKILMLPASGPRPDLQLETF